MKRMLMVTTGGTIASQGENGLAPHSDAQNLLSRLLADSTDAQIDTLPLMSIDSTNMTPRLMRLLATKIHSHLTEYDAFIITHGTDTLGYTAAALVYMLPALSKPVVLTGSQQHISAATSDARKNIRDAFSFALTQHPGVYVAFDGIIINGTHAVKMKTKSAHAFASINFPPVARVKSGRIYFNSDYLQHTSLPSKKKESSIYPAMEENIALIKIFPGMNPRNIDETTARGVIIEGYGTGGVPTKSPDLVASIEKLTKKQVAVVIASQCLEEGIDLSVYAINKRLTASPIILGGDMTTEALVMKLMWALSNCSNLGEVKNYIEASIFHDRSN